MYEIFFFVVQVKYLKTLNEIDNLFCLFFFFKTQDLIHNINNPSLFRCEYRSPDKFLSRNVRFKVEIIPDSSNANTNTTNANGQNSILTNNINVNNTNNNNVIINTIKNDSNNNNTSIQSSSPAAPQSPSYKILFTLINGSTKQFHQLCKHICSLISMNYSSVHSHRQQQQQLQQQQRLAQQQQQQQQQMQQTLPQQINNYVYSMSPQQPMQQQQQQQQQPHTTAITHHYHHQHYSAGPTTPTYTSSSQLQQQSPLISQQGRNPANTSLKSYGTPSPSVVSSRRNSNNIQIASPSAVVTSALANLTTSLNTSTNSSNIDSTPSSSQGSSSNPFSMNTPLNQTSISSALNSSSSNSNGNGNTNGGNVISAYAQQTASSNAPASIMTTPVTGQHSTSILNGSVIKQRKNSSPLSSPLVLSNPLQFQYQNNANQNYNSNANLNNGN